VCAVDDEDRPRPVWIPHLHRIFGDVAFLGGS